MGKSSVRCRASPSWIRSRSPATRLTLAGTSTVTDRVPAVSSATRPAGKASGRACSSAPDAHRVRPAPDPGGVGDHGAQPAAARPRHEAGDAEAVGPRTCRRPRARRSSAARRCRRSRAPPTADGRRRACRPRAPPGGRRQRGPHTGRCPRRRRACGAGRARQSRQRQPRPGGSLLRHWAGALSGRQHQAAAREKSMQS